MKTFRKNAVIAGVLFFLATIAGVISASIYSPIINAADSLTRMSASEGRVISAALLTFIMAVSCAGVGLALYPIMKRFSEGMAIGIVGFRIMEALLQIMIALSMIALLGLSRQFVGTESSVPAHLQDIQAVIRAGSDWLSNGAMLLCWCIGALMYYFIFYRYKLVPRWLSGWGLAGITITTISSAFAMAGITAGSGAMGIAINLPIAIQEMVFAAWLILKGIDISRIKVDAVKLV